MGKPSKTFGGTAREQDQDVEVESCFHRTNKQTK
jgi:hypothetical protein